MLTVPAGVNGGAAVTKWKYMTAQFVTTGLGDQSGVEKVQENANALGLYGWELVSTNVYHNQEVGQDVLILFFKKPVSEDVLTTPTPQSFGYPTGR
mgnify:CR=1 FL=1